MVWHPTSLVSGEALAFCAHEGSLFVSHYDPAGGSVYRSSDGGRTWEPGRGLPPEVPVAALVSGRAGLIAGTVGRGTYRSLDAGVTWRAAAKGLPEGAAVAALVAHGDTLIAGTLRSGLFRSANGGVTWAAANEGLPLQGQGLCIYALTADGTGVYVSHPFGLHASVDRGTSWHPLGGGLPAGRPFVLLRAAGERGLYASDARRLYRSADGARSWTWHEEEAWGGGLLRTLEHRSGTLFASTQGAASSAVYGSFNAGAAWQPLSEGLPADAWSISLGVAGETLLASVADAGVWRRDLPPAPGGHDALRFHLGQNEPNPFSGRTRIPYRLLAAGHVRLDVCDPLGHVLRTPVAARLEAGDHGVDFDGTTLPAGLYLCRLTVGAARQVRPMVLLK